MLIHGVPELGQDRSQQLFDQSHDFPNSKLIIMIRLSVTFYLHWHPPLQQVLASEHALHNAVCGVQNEGSSMSKAGIGKLQNLSVTVQRRWNNVMEDSTRQLIVEMFLGLRMSQHFPSVKLLHIDSTPLGDESDTEGEQVHVCL